MHSLMQLKQWQARGTLARMQTRQLHLSMHQVCLPLECTRIMRSERGFIHSSEEYGTEALLMRICIADVQPGHTMCSSVQGAYFRRCADSKDSYINVRPAT